MVKIPKIALRPAGAAATLKNQEAKSMKEAEKILNNKGFSITNQFDGFFGTVTNEYELYKGDECVMDHLSESQIIALASIL